MDVQVGDHLLMKKQHPCGSREFLVLRVGADFRIRCVQCGRELMAPRVKVERHIREIVRTQQTVHDPQ
ncbi:MAG: DUF951 domain-containing protein [Oscillospiraceae bacterium]